MLLLAALACAPPAKEAPPTFDELNIGAIVDFHDDAGETSVVGLRDWLVDHQDEWAGAEWTGGYRLGAVDEDALGSVEHGDGTIWAEVLGAGVPLQVRGDVVGYADAATEPDQTFADDTYLTWNRTITGGTAADFVGGADMETDNFIEKSGPFGVVISYDANKDFRWFGDILAARTWVPEEGWDEDHVNGIICGFTIELWFEDDGQTFFYNGSWTQIATPFGDDFPEDLQVDEFIDGTIDYMLGTEAFVMGEYVPDEE